MPSIPDTPCYGRAYFEPHVVTSMRDLVLKLVESRLGQIKDFKDMTYRFFNSRGGRADNI